MKTIRRIYLLSLVLSGVAFAQSPPRPPIPNLPGGPSTAGEEAEEGDPIPQNLTQILRKPEPDSLYPSGLEFPNIDGHGMASLYQSATGKRVLVSSAAKDAQFSFIQSGGLTNGEVAQLVEKFLLMEGFQLNADQRNPNIVSFVAASQPGGPASTVEPIKVLTDPSQLALETGIVAYVMKFQYLKPEEAQRAFTQVYGQFRPGGTIAEVTNASSLIITEKAPLIQSLLKLKNEIDVPSAQVATAWVEIIYADVQELADQLNEMFNAQTGGNQSAGVQRQQGSRPATPPIPGLPNANANAGGGGAAGEENPPQITPDSRTNRIFLMGRPIDLVFIKELIAQWDVKSSDRNFLKRKLKYLPVFSFVPIAESAISSTLSAGASEGGSRSSSNANNRQLGNTGNNNPANNNGNNNGTNNGGTGGSTGGGIGSATLNSSNRPVEPSTTLVGNTLLVSDNVANSIIVQGPPHHIELVESLIDELDVKSEQVAVEAVFARFGVEDNLSFGINLAQLLEGNGIGAQTLTGAGFIDPSTISDFAGIVTGAANFDGGLNLQGIAGDFGIFVSALETYTNFKSFARPTVFTTNNQEARISSGRQIAITTESSGTGFSNVSTDFRDVGLELLVRPLVNSNDEITLEISIVRETVGNASSVTGENIPDFLSDQLETTVTVPNGAAVLLGGLIEDDESSADAGVPILRAIPLIGNLFKENVDAFSRSELVIMIRPTIVAGQVQIKQYQDSYDFTSNVSGESRKQFSAPKYGERRNSAAGNIFGKKKKSEAPQVVVPSNKEGSKKSSPTRRAMSPIQQALYDKKRRAAGARGR